MSQNPPESESVPPVEPADPNSPSGSHTAPENHSQPWGQPPEPQGYDPAYGQPQAPYGQPQPPDPSALSGGYDPNQPPYGAGPPPGYAVQNSSQGQGQYPGQPPMSGQPALSPSDERLWGTLSHISIPFFGFIGPLVVYLLFKDRSRWLKDSAVEALNFSIFYTIAQAVCYILIAVVIGAVLLPIVFIGALVFCILAAIATNKGELYKYPVNWRLVK